MAEQGVEWREQAGEACGTMIFLVAALPRAGNARQGGAKGDSRPSAAGKARPARKKSGGRQKSIAPGASCAMQRNWPTPLSGPDYRASHHRMRGLWRGQEQKSLDFSCSMRQTGLSLFGGLRACTLLLKRAANSTASKKSKIVVEKLAGEAGSEIKLDKVLMLGGADVKVGAPYVENAAVTAEVVEQGRGAKVMVFKRWRRNDSRKLRGHRQDCTTIRVKSING